MSFIKTMNPVGGGSQGSLNSTMNIDAHVDVSQTLQQSQSVNYNKNSIVSASDNCHVNISPEEEYYYWKN